MIRMVRRRTRPIIRRGVRARGAIPAGGLSAVKWLISGTIAAGVRPWQAGGAARSMAQRHFAAFFNRLGFDAATQRTAQPDRRQTWRLDPRCSGDPPQAMDGVAQAVFGHLAGEIQPDDAPDLAVLLDVDQSGDRVAMEDRHGEIEPPLVLRRIGLELVGKP